MPTRVVVTIIVQGAETLRDGDRSAPYAVDVEMEPAELSSTTVRMGPSRRLLGAGVAALVATLLVAAAVMRHSPSDSAAASSVPTSARTSANPVAPERGPLVYQPNVWSAAIPTTAMSCRS
jgi:hypothetical protein